MQRSYEIYVIESDAHWYVGSASGKHDAAHRFKMHYAGHGNARQLYSKLQELGVECFQQTVLESGYGDPIEAEQRWYEWYVANDPRQTLNLRSPSHWGEPRPHTPEELQKMSDARQGYRASPETCQKMREAMQGRKITWGAKISAAKRGHHHTDETKAKLRAAHLGRKTGRPPIRVACQDCDMVTVAPAMGRYMKTSGHRGHRPVGEEITPTKK
jgi:hypothetical protein